MFENQIEIAGKVFEIKPVKMKYLKNNFYNCYMLLKKYGLMKVLNFEDGMAIVTIFLKAVFDEGDINNIAFLTENLDEITMKNIIQKVKQINEIEDESDTKNE